MKEKNTNKTAATVILVAGIFMIIMGSVVLFTSVPGTMRIVKFGGDYQTYTVEYLARTGNALINMFSMLKTALGSLLIGLGGVNVGKVLPAFLTDKKEDKPAESTVTSENQ